MATHRFHPITHSSLSPNLPSPPLITPSPSTQVVQAAMRGDSAEHLSSLVEKIKLPEARAKEMSKSMEERLKEADPVLYVHTVRLLAEHGLLGLSSHLANIVNEGNSAPGSLLKRLQRGAGVSRLTSSGAWQKVTPQP